MTPFSFYLVRSDRKWVTEVATTTACQTLKDHFSKDPQKQLLSAPGAFQRTFCDYSATNLKFDQAQTIALVD